MIASHSGVSGVQEHPHDLFDQVRQFLHRDRGLASVVGYHPYLSAVPEEQKVALAALRADLIIRDTVNWAQLGEAGPDVYFARRIHGYSATTVATSDLNLARAGTCYKKTTGDWLESSGFLEILVGRLTRIAAASHPYVRTTDPLGWPFRSLWAYPDDR